MKKKLIVILLIFCLIIQPVSAKGFINKIMKTVFKPFTDLLGGIFDIAREGLAEATGAISALLAPFSQIISTVLISVHVRSFINELVEQMVDVLEECYPYIGSANSSRFLFKSTGAQKVNLFNALFAFCFILEVMFFAIKTITNNITNQSIMKLILRVGVCIILYRYISFLPSVFMSLVRYAASVLVGDPGSLSSFMPGDLFYISDDTANALLTAFGLYVASALVATPVGVGISGNVLSNIANFHMMNFTGAISVSFMTASLVAVWYIEFYVLNLAMYMIIPTMVFEGFTVDVKTVLRTYYFQALKVFLAIVIGYVTINNTSDAFGLDLLLGGLFSLLQAIVTYILIKNAPNILTSLHRGFAVESSDAGMLISHQMTGLSKQFSNAVSTLGKGLGALGNPAALRSLMGGGGNNGGGNPDPNINSATNNMDTTNIN